MKKAKKPAKRPAPSKPKAKAKTPVKKSAPKKVPAKKAPAKKIVKKAPAKKTVAKKPVAKKPAPAKKVPAKKAPAKISKKAPPKKAAQKAPVKKAKAISAAAATAQAKTPKAAPKADLPSAAAATALKGKILQMRKRPTLKGAKSTPMFTFEDASELLGMRKGELKIFRPLEIDSAKAKVQKKQKELLPKIKRRNIGAASLDDILGTQKDKVAKEYRDPDMNKIPKKFQRHYKILLELRAKLKETLSERTEDTLKRSAKDDSGDLTSYSYDSGTDTFDRDFAFSLVSSEQDLLFEIEQAIKRLGDGTYGICEITGKPIPADRLLAVPFTRYSLEGQKELEQIAGARRSYLNEAVNLADSAEDDAPVYGDGDDEE